ncbi:fucose operon FucU protein [Suicoccus acidiformans]|uniref:Fucose operon FucU protein n=1 Tax=Suicoccus acidiformans TaxID=2036206 RepID=A0A347WIP5_9LACT|nr:RbsD/FucU domain-containing protein [Suicoccus acidiformans]AXY24952.1 fucose operon FucU protein [Suicoccus acidiformans]
MLRNIPDIISPSLMQHMMEMGHSDKLVIVDANFPAFSHAQKLEVMNGVKTDELLEAILTFYPLDDFINDPVYLMNHRASEPIPEVWVSYKDIIKTKDFSGAFDEFHYLERLDFYKEVENAYYVVQTNDTRRYANIILQKGVC